MLRSFFMRNHSDSIVRIYSAKDIPDEYARAQTNKRYDSAVSIVRSVTRIVITENPSTPPSNRYPVLKALVFLSEEKPAIHSEVKDQESTTPTPFRYYYGKDKKDKRESVLKMNELLRGFSSATNKGNNKGIIELVVSGVMTDDLMMMALLFRGDPVYNHIMFVVSDDTTMFFPTKVGSPTEIVYRHLYHYGNSRVRYLDAVEIDISAVESLSDFWTGLDSPATFSKKARAILEGTKADFFDSTHEDQTAGVAEFRRSVNSKITRSQQGSLVDVDAGRILIRKKPHGAIKPNSREEFRKGMVYSGLFSKQGGLCRFYSIFFYTEYLSGRSVDSSILEFIKSQVRIEPGLIPERPKFASDSSDTVTLSSPDVYESDGSGKNQISHGFYRTVSIPPPVISFQSSVDNCYYYYYPICQMGAYTDSHDFDYTLFGAPPPPENQSSHETQNVSAPPGATNTIDNKNQSFLNSAVSFIGSAINSTGSAIGEALGITPNPANNTTQSGEPNNESSISSTSNKPVFPTEISLTDIKGMIISIRESNKLSVQNDPSSAAPLDQKSEPVQLNTTMSITLNDQFFAWGHRYMCMLVKTPNEEYDLSAAAAYYLYYRTFFAASSYPLVSTEETRQIALLYSRSSFSADLAEQTFNNNLKKHSNIKILYDDDKTLKKYSSGLLLSSLINVRIARCVRARVSEEDYNTHYASKIGLFEWGPRRVDPINYAKTLTPRIQARTTLTFNSTSTSHIRYDETVSLMLIDRAIGGRGGGQGRGRGGGGKRWGKNPERVFEEMQANFRFYRDMDWYFPIPEGAGAELDETTLKIHFRTNKEAIEYAAAAAERFKTRFDALSFIERVGMTGVDVLIKLGGDQKTISLVISYEIKI